MDLLDFDGEQMYFDQPLNTEVAELIDQAAHEYGDDVAESHLMRAYFLAPEDLSVLVALYRYFYYRHRYADALIIAERAIALTADRLGVDRDWRRLDTEALGHAVLASMTLTRFLLLALKGAGYLRLRLGDIEAGLECLEKVAALDDNDRLGMGDLLKIARAKLTEERVAARGDNVQFLRR
jgi:tetratricopeptide (TPR) repeat protein